MYRWTCVFAAILLCGCDGGVGADGTTGTGAGTGAAGAAGSLGGGSGGALAVGGAGGLASSGGAAGAAASCGCTAGTATLECFCAYYGCPTESTLAGMLDGLCAGGGKIMTDVVEAFEYDGCNRVVIEIRGYYAMTRYVLDADTLEVIGASHGTDTGAECPDGTFTIGEVSAGEFLPIGCDATACIPGCDLDDTGETLTCPPDAGQ